MSFYRVSSAELRNSADKLAVLEQRFRAQKEELVGKEQALRALWEGEANDIFHSAFVRDTGQMDAFSQVINEYVSIMGTIADRYDSAEARNLGIAQNRGYV